jgi:ATP-binding cassette subfamily B protein
MYLLDEPTAHLDQAGEDVVLEGLAAALRRSSALIVSHRPALARLADRAVALHQGRFVPVDREDLAVQRAPAGATLA